MFHVTPEMQAILEPVLSALVTAFFSILVALVGYIAAKARVTFQDARSQLSTQQQTALDSFMDWAIKAAEQMGLSKQIEDLGTAKKDWAINAAQAWCDARGIKIPVSVLEVILEKKILEGLEKGGVQPKPFLSSNLTGYVGSATMASSGGVPPMAQPPAAVPVG